MPGRDGLATKPQIYKLRQSACTFGRMPTSGLRKTDDWRVLESISHLTERPSGPINTVQYCKQELKAASPGTWRSI